ncbi:MAG: universal stress protein [Ilumatobacteraceae bacterium]
MTTTDDDALAIHRSWPDEGPWVVGVDGSDCSRAALGWASANADGRATALRLVTAWQAPVYGPHSMTGPVAVPYDVEAVESAARDDLSDLADATRRQVEVPVEPVVVRGGAAPTLLDAASDAALLVVGNRGRGGFSRLLLGSTSTQCATHAPVPTAVVPGDLAARPTRRLLVGLDGSPNAMACLEWALLFAQPGTAIDITWVWDASPLAVGADQFFFPDASETAEERFHHLIDRVAASTDHEGVTITRSFVRGRPRTTLATAAEDNDLVVVGARGHGAVGAALLGSVSSWMLHHVHRPIVVVPDGNEPVVMDPE